MIPAPFHYLCATGLDEALAMLAQHGDDAKIMAGAHSLLPAMKLRLAQPKVVIDIGRIAGLDYIEDRGKVFAVGALATHAQVADSALLKERCPLLPEVAPQIGDVQVRNRGTIGGSLVHADPAADWPAAILALEADLEVVGPKGSRIIPAKKFFVDLFQTALQPNEILKEIRFPETGKGAAYVKTFQRASGFSIAGAAVVLDFMADQARIGISGVAAVPYRAKEVEAALKRKKLDLAAVPAASAKAAQGITPLGDIHASAQYRAHLACVNTRRAIELAISRV